MRIVVTGATGFLGQHVVAAAVAQGHDVLAVSRSSGATDNAIWRDKVRFITCDVLALGASAYETLGKPDVLVHLAWNELQNFKSINHIGIELPRHYAFLAQLVNSGLPTLVATGTCLEYGLQSGCLSETQVTVPGTPYGFAKDALCKQLTFLQAEQPFSLTWARMFYMYGDSTRSTIYSQIKSAVTRGDSVFSMSDGEQLRDYLPVEEAGHLITRLAGLGANIGPVNVCSGKPISVRRLVESWIQDNNWNITLNLGQRPYPDYEPLAFWGDRSKLDNSLRMS